MSQSTTNVIKTYPQGTVELAQHHDLPVIHSIVQAAYSPYIPRLNGKHPAPMTADYPALIQAKQLYILRPSSLSSSSSSPTIAGCISLSLSPTQSLEINNLAVNTEMQGHGYGKLLMGFADDFAVEKSCKRVELYTNVKMVENLRLYAKLGFEEVGRWSEDGFERVFFRKEVV